MKLRDRNTGPHAVYTTGEAAEMSGLSQQTIIRCFDDGTLKGFRVPGSKFRRIPRKELIAFVVRNGVPPDRMEPLSDEDRAAAEKAKAKAA